MANCGNKIKNTCAEKNYATCIYYEQEVPNFSGLVEESCITLEDTTKDIYTVLTGIKSELDLSALGDDCEFAEQPSTYNVKNVLKSYENEICTLKQRVLELENEALCNKLVTGCVDLTGLVDQCNSPISTLGELLQYLVDKSQMI